MPLYDYRCASCGDFREFQPMRESAAAQICPVCGAPSERVIAAPFLAGAEAGAGTAQGTANSPFGTRRACGHTHGCTH
jgi:putative FmdB family regulatory protein